MCVFCAHKKFKYLPHLCTLEENGTNVTSTSESTTTRRTTKKPPKTKKYASKELNSKLEGMLGDLHKIIEFETSLNAYSNINSCYKLINITIYRLRNWKGKIYLMCHLVCHRFCWIYSICLPFMEEGTKSDISMLRYYK